MTPLVTAALSALVSGLVTALSGLFFGRLADVSAFVRRRPTLVRAGILTAVSLGLFATLYSFVFAMASCKTRSDVACMLNANQGVLATLSLLVAALTILLTVITRESLALREERQEMARLAVRLQLLVGELEHNLRHIALMVGPDGDTEVTAFPHVTFLQVETLANYPRPDLVSSCVLERISTLLRFRDYAARFATEIPLDGAEDAASSPPPQLRATVESMALQLLHLLFTLVGDHRSLVEPCFRRILQQRLLTLLSGLHAHNPPTSCWVYFLSSDADLHPSTLRASGLPVLLWADDKHYPDMEVREVGRVLADMSRHKSPGQ